MSDDQDRMTVATTDTMSTETRSGLQRRGLLTGAVAGGAAAMLAGLATQARAAAMALPGASALAVRLHQPCDDEPLLRSDPVRHR